jgi:hypothetical protein
MDRTGDKSVKPFNQDTERIPDTGRIPRCALDPWTASAIKKILRPRRSVLPAA